MIDFRKKEVRDAFMLEHGRLPTKKEHNTAKGVEGSWKKNKYPLDELKSLGILLKIMNKNN